MAQSEKDLEKQLVEFGNVLLSPPTSVTELLPLLDRVENALAGITQSRYESLKNALSLSIKALISDCLLRHPDVDVKVSVASCISELTRITAPDAPYEDDDMKEVFKLIVSSFEHLDDKASPSYFKRISILETVAKVRSCVVMLDLECDDLIAEMFGHFFRYIRNHHPENVFSSMETIMVVVLEESEDMSSDLLTSILDVLKTENKDVLPIARQLAENVVEKCASKLKPDLLSVFKSQHRCFGDYSKVVSNACGIDEDSANKYVVGENGNLQKETDDITAGDTHSKEAYNKNNQANSDDKEPTKTEAGLAKTDAGSLDVEEPVKSQSKPEKSSKPKGRKTIVLKGLTEPSERSEADDKTEVMKDQEDNVAADVTSPSCSENHADESRPKRIGRGKKKDDSVYVYDTKRDGDTNRESNLKNTSKESGVLEINSKGRSAKKVRIIDDVDASNKEDETEEVDDKRTKKSGKKVEINSSECEDKKKGTTAKDAAKTPSRSSGKITPKSFGKSTKDESDVKKTVQTSSKRKRSAAEEKASNTKEYGAELVGTKVKVWWPQDKVFYPGVVKFFDDVKKKHTVLYEDNEVEILNLAKEKWEIVSEEHGADEVYEEGPDESSETPKVKKAKTSAKQGSKQGDKDGTSSKKGDKSSTKSKATPKPDLKKKDGTKTDGKSKVKSSNSGGGKSKVTKTGKSLSDETSKPEEEVKGGNKSKQDTLKVTAKSKGKSSKTGSKSTTNGSHKVKVVSKDSEDGDEGSDTSPEPTKTTEAISKSQKSQSARKRKRKSVSKLDM